METEMVDSVKYIRDSESCEARVLEILARRSSMMVQILRGDGLTNEDQRLVRLWLDKVPRIVRLIIRLSVFVAAAIGARAVWAVASGNPDLVHALASVLVVLVFPATLVGIDRDFRKPVEGRRVARRLSWLTLCALYFTVAITIVTGVLLSYSVATKNSSAPLGAGAGLLIAALLLVAIRCFLTMSATSNSGHGYALRVKLWVNLQNLSISLLMCSGILVVLGIYERVKGGAQDRTSLILALFAWTLTFVANSKQRFDAIEAHKERIRVELKRFDELGVLSFQDQSTTWLERHRLVCRHIGELAELCAAPVAPGLIRFPLVPQGIAEAFVVTQILRVVPTPVLEGLVELNGKQRNAQGATYYIYASLFSFLNRRCGRLNFTDNIVRELSRSVNNDSSMGGLTFKRDDCVAVVNLIERSLRYPRFP
ncbi:hypothetical protein [Actinomyces oris]|uniref:hypothetical protein n=1 Tax=Actinomyces oris TaxID=544580 RepID=UPI001C4C5ED6|nr:hypothetical protein [Actinomyces oris]